jgi:omega-6 fatty acid desaturase (delta-12 desaturase)
MPLQWFSGNIGYHHLHHLQSKVPFYELPRLATSGPEVLLLGLTDIVNCFRLKLFCEQRGRLLSFSEALKTPP